MRRSWGSGGGAYPFHALLHGIRGSEPGDGPMFPLFFRWQRLFSSVISFVRTHLQGTGLTGGIGKLATNRHARTVDRERTAHTFAMIYLIACE